MILALDCHKNKIYLLTKSGKILTYERNRLIKLRDVTWPYTSNLYKRIYLFRGNIFFYCGNFSFVYFYMHSVYIDECFIVFSDYSTFHISLADNKEVTYTDLFVSCILLHGNVLIIGTYFGLVSIQTHY